MAGTTSRPVAARTTARSFSTAFDLLELDGVDYWPQPLEARKARLEKLLKRAASGIHFVEHMAGDGATIFAHACKLGFEGIVSKHRERPYRSGPVQDLG